MGKKPRDRLPTGLRCTASHNIPGISYEVGAKVAEESGSSARRTLPWLKVEPSQWTWRYRVTWSGWNIAARNHAHLHWGQRRCFLLSTAKYLTRIHCSYKNIIHTVHLQNCPYEMYNRRCPIGVWLAYKTRLKPDFRGKHTKLTNWNMFVTVDEIGIGQSCCC